MIFIVQRRTFTDFLIIVTLNYWPLNPVCPFPLPVFAANYKFERINKDDVALLVVDHQIGLFQLVRNYEPKQYRNSILAHAAIGKVFNLPTVLTTSAETEIVEMHLNAPFIKRNGEVDAWDNSDFCAAVRATGGITTDVCTTLLALALVREGYIVFANAEASGAHSQRITDDANDRMRAAGVHVLSSFAVVCDLMRDWKDTPGSKELLPYFDKYLAVYGYLARGHAAAVDRGTIIPGESE
ncbi:Isochorismatase-like protein [Gymnopilus junonius]|uniref:Isochorismatase-like protein n=1 Tax=Gymnopilus junonius TaxID=109634 RepID=A0A9P5NK93_GYMJU|nr:Isochorismatase-like protein [Gymnopilus junonius]